ncbi:FHA domain-containing protein [Ornithinimicrobium avium]|uniref:FHA domain-containing protein n=2 Tax=Ornithinimicrobium avium TaxID=2283195 RepID=A0A345NSE8_9MICO|nr:FHA domain-containing protein [Ornithinimicrobium avium]
MGAPGPEAADEGGAVPSDDGDDSDEPAEPLATSLQAAEPLEASIDPRRDADDIELPTTAEELGLDEADLERRPTVPPPTPPPSGQAHEAHERPAHRPPSRERDSGWVAELWVDHAWAATRDSDQPVPDAGPPEVVRLTTDNLIVGRTNLERGLHPDLDAGTDAGVSVRHVQLTSDGHRWWVEDLDTANGTYVGTVGEPLPTEPLGQGVRVEVDEDDRVFLGGWTRLVLRREG